MNGAGGRPTTRRELIRAGLGAATSAGAAAGGSFTLSTGAAVAAARSDDDRLVLILGTELLAQFVYDHVLATHLMSENAQTAAARMLSQEREHIRRITAELETRGGTPPQRITSVTEANAVLVVRGVTKRLTTLRTERDCITLLAEVESLLEGAYFRAIPKLSNPGLVLLCAEVMASESQHFAVLNELTRPGNVQKAVPGPYVRGS